MNQQKLVILLIIAEKSYLPFPYASKRLKSDFAMICIVDAFERPERLILWMKIVVIIFHYLISTSIIAKNKS